jgi:hypothetical protein
LMSLRKTLTIIHFNVRIRMYHRNICDRRITHGSQTYTSHFHVPEKAKVSFAETKRACP